MMPTPPRHRRTVLILAACALLHGYAVGQPLSVKAGPMGGYGEMTEVMLWVQLTGEGDVAYRYRITGRNESARTTGNARAPKATDFIVHTRLTDLEPGQRYEYELLLNGKPVKRGYRLTFQTQPLRQWRTDPPSFTVAIGSCAFINDPPSDRPGDPYGGDYEIFAAIATMNPDLMLWLGDNTYYREIDWTTRSRMMYRNSHTRSLPEMQPLLGATHHYAIWDDHDYGPNNSDRSFAMRHEAIDVFKLFWANKTYGTPEVPGVFSRFEWGDVEFFLLDNRYHRAPNNMPDDTDKTMFGKGQLQWLKDCLVSSTAPFKLVAAGNQMLVKNRFETFADYSQEQQELINWIKQQRIGGVVVLSGDRHLTELNVLRDTAFYPLYEFTSSPLTSGVSTGLFASDSTMLVEGTLVNDVRNFGLLRFDGPRTDRRLTMECYDKDGRLRWSHSVMARELRPR